VAVSDSGCGMNSVSPGAGSNRPACQSSFACSIRSFELETKFHQMWRLPSIGSPPSSITRTEEDSGAAGVISSKTILTILFALF
jgi:hypothetical protein